MTATRILSISEAEELSKARELLRSIEDRMMKEETFGAGRAHEAVTQAEEGVFEALNVLGNGAHCEVAEEFMLTRNEQDRKEARRRLWEKRLARERGEEAV